MDILSGSGERESVFKSSACCEEAVAIIAGG